MTFLPQPKPEPRQRTKSRKDRHASAVARSVRAECVERDGFCRIGDWEMNPDDWHADELQVEADGAACDWHSEWAHLGEKKRARTGGQAPEARHTTAGSLMLCRFHHREYDAGRLVITGLDGMAPDANKPLAFAPKREEGLTHG